MDWKELVFGMLFLVGLYAFLLGFWMLMVKVDNHKIDE